MLLLRDFLAQRFSASPLPLTESVAWPAMFVHSPLKPLLLCLMALSAV
jgi:hypothetical protein